MMSKNLQRYYTLKCLIRDLLSNVFVSSKFWLAKVFDLSRGRGNETSTNIVWYLYSRFVRYLYSTKQSWIITIITNSVTLTSRCQKIYVYLQLFEQSLSLKAKASLSCKQSSFNEELATAGFAKSRHKAQGTLHGPRLGGPLHSSHPAVQFRILVSGILQRMFWSVFQNGRRWVLVSLQFQFLGKTLRAHVCCLVHNCSVYTRILSKDLTFVPWAKSNKKIQGLQGIETIEIAKKPKLTFFHFGTQFRTCAVKYRWQKF